MFGGPEQSGPLFICRPLSCDGQRSHDGSQNARRCSEFKLQDSMHAARRGHGAALAAIQTLNHCSPADLHISVQQKPYPSGRGTLQSQRSLNRLASKAGPVFDRASGLRE